MPWVKLDDGYFDHPKAIAAGPLARELNFAAWCWTAANGTDGHIPSHVVPFLAAKAGVKVKLVARLLEVGLWDVNGDGYIIHDWLDRNISKAEHDAILEQKRRAGRKGADTRWHNP